MNPLNQADQSPDKSSNAFMGLRVIWGLFFLVLVIGAIVFGFRQTKVVVIHGHVNDEQAINAFDAGLLSGMKHRSGVQFRSLRITAKGDTPKQYCAGIWYALKNMDPSLLILVGEKAQACLDDPSSSIPSTMPRIVVGAQENERSVLYPKQSFLRHEIPASTWADALLSQRVPGKDSQVVFLAADSTLARAQQKEFASLALAGVNISTRLVTTWPQWQVVAQQASRDNALLVVGGYRELKDLPSGLHDPMVVVKMTRALFGKDMGSTEIRSVGAGASSWAIEPEPGSIGRRAAGLGLVLLGDIPAAAVPAQTLSIAMDAEFARHGHRLPPLFEAVARNQGLYR